MSSLKILVSFFLFLFPELVTRETLAYCGYPLSCGVGEPQIQFPFILDGRQSKACREVPDYDLSCNSSNKTFRDHRNLFLPGGILMQSTDTTIVIRTGLDDATIKSYQGILLDEKLQLPNLNDTTCSICLSEYRPTETLKIIPLCNHYFHAKCIDPWLRMHTTCPVCRKSLHQHSVLLPAADAS
ncbi:hypothetical protein MKW92_047360 [Papaver armeniacum]|nr:hypothetical protein MKW92_047360 [Papaver armeniacum]